MRIIYDTTKSVTELITKAQLQQQKTPTHNT